MIHLSSLGLRSSCPNPEPIATPGESILVAPMSRDRSLFDSGSAFGRAMAAVPVSGQGTAGFTIQVRAVSTDDGGATSTTWTDLAVTGPEGGWSGSLTVPRSPSWYRIEARLKEKPAIKAQSATRFGVGHVLAIWGQSEVERIISTYYNGTAAPAVIDPEAVQIFTGAAVSPARAFVTTTTPQTAAVATLANTLIASRPGEKFAVIFHSVPGTDPRDLVDDGQSGRSWDADKALHDFACADGQSVGIAAMSWFASPRSLAANYGDALFPLFSGKTLSGAPVTIPGTISHPGGSYHADHWFGELYDYQHTRWVPYGPHRFDAGQDLRDATHLAGGGAEAGLTAIQSCRSSWRAMLASPHATMFLPLGIEPGTYVNGFDDGVGGWTDIPHPAGNTPDGAARWARLTAHAILRSAGLVSWPVPEFDQCQWQPDGSHVEVWSSAGPVTTTRIARSEPALPATFAHWTEVAGFQINGAPAPDAHIVAGRVRLSKPGGFAHGDTLTFGEGGATGMLKFPEDQRQGLWKNLPIVDVGAPGIEGIPLRPMPLAATLANTLPAALQSFIIGAAGPRFVDPAAIGAASRLTVVYEGAFDTPAASCQPLVPTGGNLTFTLLSTRKPRLYFKDSANTVFVNSVSLTNALPTGPVRVVLSVDLVAGYLRFWVNGALEGNFVIAANSGLVATTTRQICLMATNTGGSQASGVFTRLAVWKAATVDGSDPAGPAYKVLTGPATNINLDGWKQGAHAT